MISRLVLDAEGAAVKLSANERQLVMALGARWNSLERSLRASLPGLAAPPELATQIAGFSRYVQEAVARITLIG
jgi:hypothetical protein